MPDKITFKVPGRPRPQGSMRWVKSKNTGQPVPTTNKKMKEWRSDVGWFAHQVIVNRRFVGGVGATLIFTFERPKKHYRTGKFSHILRDDAPERHTQTPDVDKLIRAVLDALTGVAYGDDCVVDRIGASKRWGSPEGLECTLRGTLYGEKEDHNGV